MQFQDTTPHYKNQQSTTTIWWQSVIQLSSQALARYFSSQDERHYRIYCELAKLIDSGIDDNESLGGGCDSR